MSCETIERVARRVKGNNCVIFISLQDADAIMAHPPQKMSPNLILRALENRPAVILNEVFDLKCCEHRIRLDRQLGPGVVTVLVGKSADEKLKEIAARRTLPDGSGV